MIKIQRFCMFLVFLGFLIGCSLSRISSAAYLPSFFEVDHVYLLSTNLEYSFSESGSRMVQGTLEVLILEIDEKNGWIKVEVEGDGQGDHPQLWINARQITAMKELHTTCPSWRCP